jgi:hypothetical protein
MYALQILEVAVEIIAVLCSKTQCIMQSERW